MTETVTSGGDDWFYAQGSTRQGPVSAQKLLDLLSRQLIAGETLVWRNGMPDWRPLESTNIGASLKDTPPPLAPAVIKNGLVWTVALAPIPYAIFGAMIAALAAQQGPGNEWLTDMGWLIPGLLNAILCFLDTRQLKRAGYRSGWLTFFALTMTPVYLFMRAKRIRQRPTYGFAWLVSFALSVILHVL